MMTLEERAGLVLAFARVLFVNGQSTDQVLATAKRVGDALGVRGQVMVRWGELQLQFQDVLQLSDLHTRLILTTEAEPAGVGMGRVASAMRAIDELCAGSLAPAEAEVQIRAIAVFTLAAAAGATALAVIFGVQHVQAAALIFASAGAGAVLRRYLARVSGNLYVQPFCASLLAGIAGALAVRYQWSSTLRLVAVCPCMVLVPGPPILNGALDLIKGRIHLGAARILFAGLVIAAISTGLLIGLALFGVSLPVDQLSRAVPLYFDIIAAGVAIAAYGIFFSAPLRILAWPVIAGTLGHALRWWLLTLPGASPAIGALAACGLVGLVLTPVARREHIPFAAIGFSAVVSMIPGVFLFRMASGLVQLADASHATLALISGTLADGATTLTIILAMSVGLLFPKLVIDWLCDRNGSMQTKG
jgi:uncharacterized membrane protein YjjP (DUF1212 family)